MRWVLLAAAGCDRTYPLPIVPIRGGTAEVRAELRAELIEYDAQVGPGRVELRRIDVVEHTQYGTLGHYSAADRTIEMVPVAPTLTLRHELCHAIDFAERRIDDDIELYDELSRALVDHGAVPVELYTTQRAQQDEAFAQSCERGGLALWLLAEHPCEHDGDLVVDVARHLTDAVYVGFEPPDLLDLDGLPWVTPEAWTTTGEVDPTEDGQHVVVHELGESAGIRFDLDGQRLGVTGDATWATGPQIGPILRGIELEDRAGRRIGEPALAQGSASFDTFPTDSRVFVFDPADPEEWRPLDVCRPSGAEQVLVADGALWHWWNDPPLLRWVRLATLP